MGSGGIGVKVKEISCEDHILYDSIFKKDPEQENLERNSRLVVASGEASRGHNMGENEELLLWVQVSFRGEENVLN